MGDCAAPTRDVFHRRVEKDARVRWRRGEIIGLDQRVESRAMCDDGAMSIVWRDDVPRMRS
jgi:hypothetical protein